jgi:phosphoglycerol transferase MdoB-like AlkP superfamily enzyme
LGLAVFFIFRLILFFTEIDRIESIPGSFADIVTAFLIGIRFDLVISGYILVVPFIILTALFLLNWHNKLIYKILFYYIFVLFTICFIISAADIPYFNHFFMRFNIGAFLWADNADFALKMILQEPRYYLIILPLILLISGYFILLTKIVRPPVGDVGKVRWFWKIPVSILLLAAMVVGIRGRVDEKAVIKVGTAYFTDNAMLNQLGLNPVFTFMRSYLDSRNKHNNTISLVSDDVAIRNVRKYLEIGEPMGNYPIARQVYGDSLNRQKFNVIIVIMESMTASKMARHGNPKNLTPFLDSLSRQGYYFENIYTAGMHTYNGIFSTLFSLPAIWRQNPLKESLMFKYNGISHTLKKLGYSTAYFTTHDGQFDNIAGFLRFNDFDEIIDKEDYPEDQVKTTLGVPDDFMFEYSIPVINRLYQHKKPFLVTFMTASDHGPYFIPDHFTPDNEDIRDQIVEYADWSLNKFVSLASREPWFDSTLFVFIADHGWPLRTDYDIPLDYHHTPLIMYAPAMLKGPGLFSAMGGQTDVFPTIMGLLNQDYINNTLGIDLLKEKRPFVLINHDESMGVMNEEYLLIIPRNGEKGLYRYRNLDFTDYKDTQQLLVEEMEDYAYSNLQVFQYLMLHKERFVE